MAFILEDRDPSITSESAPFIAPVDYDSDVELFQVPLKRDDLPFAIPGQDLVSKAALQYALAAPARALSEESVSTYSQPHFSRNTSPQRASSSPPSSVASADIKDRQQQRQTSNQHDNKVLEAKKLQLRKGKAKTVLTTRPRRLVLRLQANTYQTGNHDDDWSNIYQWLNECHDNTPNHEPDTDTVGVLAGPQLLHPFLGPSLFSPIMPTTKLDKTTAHASQSPKINQTTLQQSPQIEPPIVQVAINPFIQLQRDQPLQDELPEPSRKSSKNTTPDSAYDRAREVELYLSESLHYTHGTPVKGKDHWVVDCDLTEVSHFRLAEIARRSAEGFDIAVVGTGQVHGLGSNDEERVKIGTAAELANLYRVLAVVHTVYGEEMRREREWAEGERVVERKGRMGSKIGSVKGRRMVRTRRVMGGSGSGSGSA